MHSSEKAGHTFLASLGKTRLRPGGIEATEWLLSQVRLTPETKVLEIACNMGTTSIALAQRFGCTVFAVDMDKKALDAARQNVAAAGLEDKIHISEANASKLPFSDESFDIVINEAMLTMYVDKAKVKLAGEYYRVLKRGGHLLTHDIMYTGSELQESRHAQLEQVVKSNVSPMTKPGWEQLFLHCGFHKVYSQYGKMSLMSPGGLIKDEGGLRALKIIYNGLRTRANRQRFIAMFRFFRRNSRRLNYIVCCSQK
ncbi:SAM-dependent methyltransferase [Izhakiella australiensis]|uniref:SAM-dependent methyltransferase n=1 Tax=Izhakiella australiensis TaxID=1926881 RepID=A0A1S8YPI2_9GAMM|nr:class I SAM-dependent methyltransferase [Izhakiella australiensis]OON41049.1 SAM-dependent methyltransferase [Izhakiella australiensis]